MLQLIRDGSVTSAAELVRRTGLARSTVSQRLDLLRVHGLVRTTRGTVSNGGRPPARLTFDATAGVVLSAALDGGRSRVAVSDLGGELLTDECVRLELADDPASVFARVDERFGQRLKTLGRSPRDVRGVGIGIPGPVAFHTGTPIAPLPDLRWEGFSIPGWFGSRYHHDTRVEHVDHERQRVAEAPARVPDRAHGEESPAERARRRRGRQRRAVVAPRVFARVRVRPRRVETARAAATACDIVVPGEHEASSAPRTRAAARGPSGGDISARAAVRRAAPAYHGQLGRRARRCPRSRDAGRREHPRPPNRSTAPCRPRTPYVPDPGREPCLGGFAASEPSAQRAGSNQRVQAS